MPERSASAAATRQNLAVLSPGVARPVRAPSLVELERQAGLRFVLRTRNRPRPETIQRRLRESHGIVADVEPLFRRLDAGARAAEIGRRYLVVLRGLSRRDLAVDSYELAYRLTETPGLQVDAAEPDLPRSLYAGNAASERIAFNAVPGCEVAADPSLGHAWHLAATRVPEAWALAPPAGGLAYGEGIVVGHPDTGWVVHDELDRSTLDTSRSWDFVDDDSDATDPLDKPWLGIGLLGQPGHGLGTGSVIVSRRAGSMEGAAPAALLVPIRTVTRVWQIFSGDIARAIEHAATNGCHVVSISLGGLPSEALERALDDAVERDLLVCAAAGNCVHVVVAPGLYPNAVCVGASNSRDRPWPGSSRGPAVDISSPGENVWVARRRKGETGTARVGQSQGTSPATATVAGIGALWLAYHGRPALLSRYFGRVRLQHVFLHLLRTTARRWSETGLGAGIVDAKALLEAPLPAAADVEAETAEDAGRMLSVDEVAARMLGEADAAPVRAQLVRLLGADAERTGPATEQLLSRYGPELLHILAEDRAAALELRASLGSPVEPTELARDASPSLRARLRT